MIFTIILISIYQRFVYNTSMIIFEYKNYLNYLENQIALNKDRRGFHGELALAAGMHPSYLSRILHGSIHLTPDQAAGLCSFWGFNHDETTYFLCLVNLARAGTDSLKKILEAELLAIKIKYDDLGRKLPAEKVDIQKENIYYSAWYFGAVHMLLTIPKFRNETQISEKLGIQKEQVLRILESLEQMELVKKEKSQWLPTKNNVHLSSKSWMANIHHINWRTKITDQIQFNHEEDFHYTGIHTLTRSDFKKIRQRLQDYLVEIDSVIRPSAEEELCCLLIDWSKF